MKSLFPILLLLVFIQTACRQNLDSSVIEQLSTELTAVKAQLEQSATDLASLKSDRDYPLVHVVFFDLKKDADTAKFMKEIQKLKGVEALKNLEVGRFADLKDPRALSQFDLVMQMGFMDEAAYKSYQTHPLHLALKESAKEYLAGPPVTYDFNK